MLPNEGHWPDAVELLYSTLAAADPCSITIVSIGFYRNLLALLDLEQDGRSSAQLLREKVERTIVMGGIFPVGREFNFVEDPESTAEFVRRWPLPIDFIGQEVGNDVITGRHLSSHLGADHPLVVAYETYCGRGVGRPSWDLIAVYAASRPNWPALGWSPFGRLNIRDTDGHNEWLPDPAGQHRFATLTTAPDRMATELDAILHLPAKMN